ERCKQRIGHALDEPDDPVDDGGGEPYDNDGAAEADQAACENVAGVVGTDEDPAEADDRRGEEKDGPGNAVEEYDCEPDRERRAGVVARKRGIVRACSPHMRRWVRRERSLPV